jgi:hypothetical protein
MSLTAAAIRLLAEKGLSALDIADIAEANAVQIDGTRNGNARRQAEFRSRKREAEAVRNVTDNVTCNVTEDAHSLLVIDTSKNKKESGQRNVTRNVTRNASPKSTRCPAEWVPDDSVFKAGRDRGLTDVQINREIENIRDTEFPKAHSDWNATARRWMRNTRPDPVGRPVLAAVPTQSPADIERRRKADAEWRAHVERSFSNG